MACRANFATACQQHSFRTIVGASVRTCSVCRADVHPHAREVTERLLLDMRQALADQEHVDPETIRIGPVDLGSPENTSRSVPTS
jgi:hypothetical protein